MRRSLKPTWLFITISALLFTNITTSPATALHTLNEYLTAEQLADPGFLLIDPTTGSTLGENKPDQPRVPASVLKLVSTTAALKIIGGEKRYITSIWSTPSKSAFVLRGEFDPWLTSNLISAKKNKQAYLPSLITRATKSRSIKLYYYGIIDKDIEELKKYLRAHRISASAIKVDSITAAEKSKEQLATVTSPPLSEIVKFTILWSDNTLADRMTRQAALKVGNDTTPSGLTKTFETVLNELGVETKDFAVEDGNGLSKANRITPRTLVQLLQKIRHDPVLLPIFEGLPIGGLTGTLKNRFTDTAPSAVGHVHAKTGWINHSVTMAGFVDDGKTEYIFAILADGISPTWKSRRSAREVMDKLLGSIVSENR